MMNGHFAKCMLVVCRLILYGSMFSLEFSAAYSANISCCYAYYCIKNLLDEIMKIYALPDYCYFDYSVLYQGQIQWYLSGGTVILVLYTAMDKSTNNLLVMLTATKVTYLSSFFNTNNGKQ